MNSVMATFRNGRVELTESVDWPDGIRVEVMPLGAPSVPGQKTETLLSQWPAGYFDRLREQWGDEPFERPPQGEFEEREDW